MSNAPHAPSLDSIPTTTPSTAGVRRAHAAPTLSPEQRRGLRMAAQIACALSLLGAGASLARAEPADPAPDGSAHAGSPAERAADALRLRSGAGNCVPSWGPAAPPSVDAALFALFLAEVA
ncbi:MAG: hypothetical protein IPQ09_26740 [Myxococcales bacterium]|nr:hypothetical protein [Myxococcales bacterium]